ncbi:hypothetical protein DL546_003179 [Coniochaeta pulveracea]|uniref:LPXTG-domain-containing protein n=1 Tax=Coniochaeta pulveracea TaxID=177199 RepID=A0A420YAT5_9PEZI|nr:hypothetical protein DL546_003179 [Coniochaeta pulveracea]
MARSSFLLASLLLLCWVRQRSVVAIQVTPNSPCSSVCVDSTELDYSDPNSSNTHGTDISCEDDQLTSSPAGMKWQTCISCLQNSTFSQGNENDQMWLLYNMRYSLAYCVFNFLNVSGITGTPCITAFACGTLTNSVASGLLSPQQTTPYGYCSADNSAMTHDNLAHCGSCVKAMGQSHYLTNSLVALDAGCQQKPDVGHTLGLNGSVFSSSIIGMVDPTSIGSPTSKSHGLGLATTTIAGIVVGIIALLLALLAIFFIRHKKRENRRKRASYESRTNTPWGPRAGHIPTSPLSFQCATQMSPKFFPSPDVSAEKETGSSYSIISSPQPNHQTSSLWTSSSFQPISAVTESPQKPDHLTRQSSYGTSPLQSNPFKDNTTNHISSVPLHNLNTSIPSTLPPYPSQTHASPLTRFSPHDFTTPTSATSIRSTAPLIPYHPAEHGTPSLQRGPSGLSPISVSSVSGSSPLLRGSSTGAWSNFSRKASGGVNPRTDGGFTAGTTTTTTGDSVGRGVWGRRKDVEGERGSPVETKMVGTSFPPPPPPRR